MFRYTLPQIILHWLVALLIAVQFVIPAPHGGEPEPHGTPVVTAPTATPTESANTAVTTAPAAAQSAVSVTPATAQSAVTTEDDHDHDTAPPANTGTPLHVWVGLAVLVLMVARLVIRLGAPAAPVEAGPLGLAAIWTHRLLYLGLIIAPIGGMLAWFGGIHEAGDIHAAMGNILFGLVGLHIVAALYHQFIIKDGLLRRMMPH